MRSKKILTLIILLVVMCTVSIGGASAMSYNGGSSNYGGSSSEKCIKKHFCNNMNFKALSITLYYVKNGSMDKVGHTVVVNNGKKNAPSQNCKIGKHNFCVQKSWFSKDTYGYDSEKISNALGDGDPNDIGEMRIKKIGHWIAILKNQEWKNFGTTEEAQNYISKYLKKETCEVTTKKGRKSNCNGKNAYGYRIIIEPVVGYIDGSGKYKTGKLRSAVKNGITTGKAENKKKFATLLATSFKDVGINYKKKGSCELSDLSKGLGTSDPINGCGWNIIDPGVAKERKCGSYKNSTFYKGFKDSATYYDANGKKIKYYKTKKKYQIGKTYYTKDELKKYIENGCEGTTPPPTCKYQNGKYYDDNGNVVDEKTYKQKCEKTTDPKKCTYDPKDGGWYDQNYTFHEGTPSNRMLSWINGKCKEGNPKPKINVNLGCTNCNSTDTTGLAYWYNEIDNDWANIVGVYRGNDAGEDTVDSHFAKNIENVSTSDDNEDETAENTTGTNETENTAEDNTAEVIIDDNHKLYCKENYKAYLPNGTTTNLKSLKSGRYITLNLDAATNLTNLSPIKVEKTTKCIAINDGTSMAASKSTETLPPQADGAKDIIDAYLDYEEDRTVGTIAIKYTSGDYNTGDDPVSLKVSKIEKASSSTTVLNKYYEGTQVTTKYYSLPDDYNRYSRASDGKVSESEPDEEEMTKYHNIGHSTLPVQFQEEATATIEFTYEPVEKVTDFIKDSNVNTTSNGCSSGKLGEGSDKYTCSLSVGNSCEIVPNPDGSTTYYGPSGKEITKEEYETICPDDPDDECDCPEGETCCWDTSMVCSVNGNCPGTGKKIIYRTIDLNNPFPGQNNNNIRTGRQTGSNWCGYDPVEKVYNCNNQNDNNIATTGSNTNQTVESHIKNNDRADSYEIYQQTPQYSFTLDSQTITAIREYNDRQNQNDDGYDDFTLDCFDVDRSRLTNVYSNRICRSTFFRRQTGSATNNKVLDMNEANSTCSSGAVADIATCSESGDNK